MNPFFSIIIPFHDAQTYLDKCIQSLLAQNFDDFEVLMVNSNSSDDSVKICKKYSSRYANFYSLSQSITGVSAARNMGLANTNGKYILFVDADDFLEPTALVQLYKFVKKKNADIVYFNMNNLDYLGISLHQLDFPFSVERRLTRPEAFQSLILENGYRGFVWNKLYLRTSIGKIKFNEKIQFLEDTLFNIDLIKQSQTIYSFPVELTNYRIHKDSFVNSRFQSEHLSYFSALEIAELKMPKIFVDDLKVLKRLAQIKFLSETFWTQPIQFSDLKRVLKRNNGVYKVKQIKLTKFQMLLLRIANYSLTGAALIFKMRSILSSCYHCGMKMIHDFHDEQ